MGKGQQKNVWLFVYSMSVAGSPSFVKHDLPAYCTFFYIKTALKNL